MRISLENRFYCHYENKGAAVVKSGKQDIAQGLE